MTSLAERALAMVGIAPLNMNEEDDSDEDSESCWVVEIFLPQPVSGQNNIIM